MPNGTILWCDPSSGEARVEHLGRMLPARMVDIEPDARTPGTTVHFDIDREGGVDRAVRVELVPGLRTSVHQHRRGDLAGHARADGAGHHASSGRRPWREPHRERMAAHEIAEIWLEHMRHGALDDAVALYAPNAQVHVVSGTVEGKEAARRALLECALFDRDDLAVGIGDEGEAAVVGWAGRDGAPSGLTRMRITHGEIAEQWLPASP